MMTSKLSCDDVICTIIYNVQFNVIRLIHGLKFKKNKKDNYMKMVWVKRLLDGSKLKL